MPMLLFVYGTLRRGNKANDLLQRCEFLGEASVAGTLYDIDGRFPALTLPGSDSVRGELWRCPDELLDVLDQYEGVGQGLFRRTETDLNGERCLVYVAGPLLQTHLAAARVIPGGDWNARGGPSVPRTVPDRE